MPERVRITDVSPRDGLQNEPGIVATGSKLELIDSLASTGVDEVEITSFVSPKWIPQLADAEEVCAGVNEIFMKALTPSPSGRGLGRGAKSSSPSPSGRGPGRGEQSDSFHYPKAEKSPGATQRARKLRKETTVPERILWSRLKADQFLSLRFRRQHPIGPYIVDFYCAAARLVVELDGRSHDGADAYQRDLIRESFLQDQGLSIIRFNNDDVLNRLEEVLANIERTIKSPLPSPPPAGEGVKAPVLSALVPNENGFDRLLAQRSAGLPLKVALFTAASETFSQKNTNASITQTLERFDPIVKQAKVHRLHVRGYLSCAIACPFEGAIDPEVVANWARQLSNLGINEIDLGDTIGTGTPETIRAMLRAVFDGLKDKDIEPRITLHLHDTFGQAAECVKTALDMGVRSFDGSVAGLGGCPYASTPTKRAPGNISTETLVRTVHDAGYETSVNLDRLSEATEIARRIVAEARAEDPSPQPSPRGGGS